jgi:nonsense-mediated mRNA decay protein 3
MIRKNFQIGKELEKVDITTECKGKKENLECKVIISGFLDDNEIVEEHNIIVRVRNNVCDVCSKQFGGYYEATIQIRPGKKKLTKDELDDIRSNVESLVEGLRAKGNRGLFITDVGEEHGGLDFYLSDRGTAYSIAKQIQEQYGGEIKQSAKNVGMEDSKQIYRMTYLVRLPSLQKGDIISFDNDFFFISSVRGNKIRLINLSNWEELVVDSKVLQNTNSLGGKELIKEMIFVSQSKSEVQLMDSETYKTIDIQKPKPTSYNTEKIKVIKVEDQIFLMPEKIK